MSKSFRDSAGRSWLVDVNVGSIKRVKALTNVDLLTILGGELIERLISDPILLCDVVYALIKPEADTLKVSDEDFGRAMAGDAIDEATSALLESITCFFPAPRRRLLARALEKMKAVESKLLASAEKQLESPALEMQIEAALKNASNLSGG